MPWASSLIWHRLLGALEPPESIRQLCSPTLCHGCQAANGCYAEAEYRVGRSHELGSVVDANLAEVCYMLGHKPPRQLPPISDRSHSPHDPLRRPHDSVEANGDAAVAYGPIAFCLALKLRLGAGAAVVTKWLQAYGPCYRCCIGNKVATGLWAMLQVLYS